MTQKKVQRSDVIDLILTERANQVINNSDFQKTKNDWTSCAGYYLFETATRSDKHVSFSEFRESLIKAAAVIVAALETSFALEEESLKELQELQARLQGIQNDSHNDELPE